MGAGLVALDVIITGNQVSLAAGGTCGNVLALLGALGWESRPVSRLNGDRAAALIKADLSSVGLDLSFTSETPEAVAPIIVERIGARRDRDHSFSFRCLVCDGWLPQYRPLTNASASSVSDRLPAHDVFFFDRVSASSVALAERSRRRGSLVYFEPSAKGDEKFMARALQVAHVVKYSAERVDSLSVESTEHLALQIVTMGARGLRYRRPGVDDGWVELPAWPVANIVDSAGAGDWFSASLLNLLPRGGAPALAALSGAELREAMLGAQAVAAWSCGFPGARGGMLEGAAEDVPVFGTMKRAQALSTSGDVRTEMSRLCPACAL